MNAKYVNGMPLDRIATDFRRNEVNISKQVMANWVIRCSERYLSPVYFRLHELLLKYNVIQQDETPVRSLKRWPAGEQQELHVGIPVRKVLYRPGHHSL